MIETPRLETRNLTKRYGAFLANSDVSLRILRGRVHAILGENGAGKSTFLNLLFGLILPDSGDILIDGQRTRWSSPNDAISSGLGMLHQHFSLIDTLSVIDNILLGNELTGCCGKLMREKAIEIVESLVDPSLRLPWHEKTKNLSIGMKQKLEIVRLLFQRSDILFLDEPTAVLTPHEIDDFFSILRGLKEKGKTIVLITHKINEVFAICDNYSIFRSGRCIDTDDVAHAKEHDLIQKMIGRDLKPLPPRSVSSRGPVVIEFDSVHMGGMERDSLRGLSLKLHSGEIFGIAGVDGAGQGQIVNSILYQPQPSDLDGGKVEVLRDVQISRIPEDRHADGLWLEESCFHNLIIGHESDFSNFGFIDEKRIRVETTKWADRFVVEGPGLDKPVKALSGGNQQKLIFAREVDGRRLKILICCHPTRGVDLGSCDLIHREILRLREKGVAILLITGDMDELTTLSDRIGVLHQGRFIYEVERMDFNISKIGAAMLGRVQ